MAITTSRYASLETRKVARTMSKESGEKYIARGKKTIANLAKDARRLGEERIIIVEERGGRAALLSVLNINERGHFSWGEERLLNRTEKTDRD